MLVFGFLLLTKSEQGLQGLGFGCFLIVLSHLRTLLINPEPVPAGLAEGCSLLCVGSLTVEQPWRTRGPNTLNSQALAVEP